MNVPEVGLIRFPVPTARVFESSTASDVTDEEGGVSASFQAPATRR